MSIFHQMFRNHCPVVTLSDDTLSNGDLPRERAGAQELEGYRANSRPYRSQASFFCPRARTAEPMVIERPKLTEPELLGPQGDLHPTSA